MPKPLIESVHLLAALLEQENAALLGMDLRRVTSLLADKAAAIADLTAAGAAASGSPHAGLATEARRLDRLALENRRLLERAMEAQRRVIGIVVRAAASVTLEPSYGATGRQACRSGAMALSTRA